jgi:hypothetical protein
VGVDVLITGVNHSAEEPPAMVLARVLGMAPEIARKVARTFPTMLIGDTTRAHAESVAAQLREGGIKVEVVERNQVAPQAPARTDKPVERSVARKSGPREVREERGVEGAGKHRDMFEERSSRTVDVPTAPKHRDAFEERMAKGEAKAPKHRDAFEERMARGDAKAPLQRGAFEERPSRTMDAPPKHRDAFEERMARGDAMQPKPLPAAAPAFEERPSRAQPAPFELKDSFDQPARPEPSRPEPPRPSVPDHAPDPFARDSGFGPLDLDRAPVVMPQAAAGVAGFADEFGADTGLRRGLDPKRPTAADATEAESLFEVPPAGRPVQPRPRQTAPSPEPRDRGERAERQAPKQAPVVIPPMAMSFSEPAPKRRRWLWTAVGMGVIVAAVWFMKNGSGEMHAGSAFADDDDGTSRPATEMHILVRMAPHGIDGSLALVLRQLVDGTYKVQINNDGFPDDAQCLLVRGDDGRRQERLEKLLKTGIPLELDEAKRAEFAEHQESLRQALGDSKLSFTPVCLSVDAWVAKQEARKKRAEQR